MRWRSRLWLLGHGWGQILATDPGQELSWVAHMCPPRGGGNLLALGWAPRCLGLLFILQP